MEERVAKTIRWRNGPSNKGKGKKVQDGDDVMLEGDCVRVVLLRLGLALHLFLFDLLRNQRLRLNMSNHVT